ncbi:hypothetical protein [Parapontixanthobacter aurantiacus]|uniref:hypothetical protein n=1 Tax=Parapontixanthobacter aurantiacus TaxID=1463599 RepID=UPI001925EE88|nr:hypothetical protein [Parapontixanthobacter aurantiacus]
MFDRQFLRSKLGQASMACTLVMVAFVALSSQMTASPSLVLAVENATMVVA